MCSGPDDARRAHLSGDDIKPLVNRKLICFFSPPLFLFSLCLTSEVNRVPAYALVAYASHREGKVLRDILLQRRAGAHAVFVQSPSPTTGKNRLLKENLSKVSKFERLNQEEKAATSAEPRR